MKALSSLRLFFLLCLFLASAFLYQTLFNRGAPVYGSWWFAGLGVLAAVNIAACSLSRRGASAHYLLIHAGLVVVIAGAFVTRAFRFEAEMPLNAGQESSLANSGRDTYKLPFSVQLEDFKLEYYREPLGVITIEEAGVRRDFYAVEGASLTLPSGKIRVLKLARDFGLTGRGEVTEKSPYWFNPAARLEITSGEKKRSLWFFANFPGMHGGELPFSVYYGLERSEIKNFTSTVLVRGPGGEQKRAEISVNNPLRVHGYTLYQTSYDPADARYTLLTVTRDRGAWVVFAGFAALLLGVLLWLRK